MNYFLYQVTVKNGLPNSSDSKIRPVLLRLQENGWFSDMETSIREIAGGIFMMEGISTSVRKGVLLRTLLMPALLIQCYAVININT